MDEFPIYFQPDSKKKYLLSLGSIFLSDTEQTLADVREEIAESGIPFPPKCTSYIFLSRLGLPITRKQEEKIEVSYILSDNDWKIILGPDNCSLRLTEEPPWMDEDEIEREMNDGDGITHYQQRSNGFNEEVHTTDGENEETNAMRRYDSLEDLDDDQTAQGSGIGYCCGKIVDIVFFIVFMILLSVFVLGATYYTAEYLHANGVKLPGWLDNWRVMTARMTIHFKDKCSDILHNVRERLEL